ncbi:hypothetical protein DFQ28_007296 [Apophysomyces sp. BC1034]|nr:hypothetical protein DFQ30_010248 [Apophysomyces sp. BC1015]KAG0186790.1 hypothetical protein DFQ28_007296 [Apophysomyces sp. BC1034]
MACTQQVKEISGQFIIYGKNAYGEESLEKEQPSTKEQIDISNDIDEATIRVEYEGPDGGYGWFVVLGAFIVQCTTFGTSTSW